MSLWILFKEIEDEGHVVLARMPGFHDNELNVDRFCWTWLMNIGF